MGRFQYNEVSSDNEKEGDDNDEEEEEEPKKVTKKKTKRNLSESGGGEERKAKEEEIQFGEQLQDDLINSFCDTLQAVCPRKLEALLAIQFLLITDKTEVRKHITGRTSAFQVLYDRTRSHYLLAHLNMKTRELEIYDSLQKYESDGVPTLNSEICSHIIHTFGHLFREYVSVVIDKEYESQADNFSCGYRVIGALVDLARGVNPAGQRYGRTRILEFMKTVLKEPNPTWSMFESAKFGISKEYSGGHRFTLYFKNTSSDESTTSSTTQSTDSLVSTCSTSSGVTKRSHSSHVSESSESTQSSGRNAYRRANAGYMPYREPSHYMDSGRYRQPMHSTQYLSNNRLARIPFRYSESAPITPTYQLEESSPETASEGASLFGYFRNSCQHLWGGLFRRPKVEEKDPEKGE